MKISVHGQQLEVTPFALGYPNDILDGVFLNGEGNYLFLSDHVEGHRGVQDKLGEMDYYDMSEQDIDYEELPHQWVVNSVAKLVVLTAEQLLDD